MPEMPFVEVKPSTQHYINKIRQIDPTKALVLETLGLFHDVYTQSNIGALEATLQEHGSVIHRLPLLSLHSIKNADPNRFYKMLGAFKHGVTYLEITDCSVINDNNIPNFIECLKQFRSLKILCTNKVYLSIESIANVLKALPNLVGFMFAVAHLSMRSQRPSLPSTIDGFDEFSMVLNDGATIQEKAEFSPKANHILEGICAAQQGRVLPAYKPIQESAGTLCLKKFVCMIIYKQQFYQTYYEQYTNIRSMYQTLKMKLMIIKDDLEQRDSAKQDTPVKPKPVVKLRPPRVAV